MQALVPSHRRAGLQVRENIRAAEAIDGLLRVADDENAARTLRVDAPEDVGLQPVRVLVLVDQCERIAVPDALRQVRGAREAVLHRDQQIVVPQRPVLPHAPVDRCPGPFERPAPGARQPVAIDFAEARAGLAQRFQPSVQDRVVRRQHAGEFRRTDVLPRRDRGIRAGQYPVERPERRVPGGGADTRVEGRPGSRGGLVPRSLRLLEGRQRRVVETRRPPDREVALRDVGRDPFHEVLADELLRQGETHADRRGRVERAPPVVAHHRVHDIEAVPRHLESERQAALEREIRQHALAEAMDGKHVGPIEVRDGYLQPPRHVVARDAERIPMGRQLRGLPVRSAPVSLRESQRRPQGPANLVPQFVRRRVGERDDEEFADLPLLLDHQAGHERGERVRLARAGARLDQRRPGRAERQFQRRSLLAGAAHAEPFPARRRPARRRPARTTGSSNSSARAQNSRPSGPPPSYASAA